ncbi:hypothetical protein V202x_27910 [Gimesia aquarii]|uniref:Uncharacterized protein n=2 Tax=Gimesia aquarii TaxID=2527964 RepID=A0A517WVX9_9PLAN|nr:hypothetical protein V202x_27910 [Gimesia aquarii]
MGSSGMVWQVMWWLLFLLGCVALYFTLTWPTVKGKSCLVVSLLVVLSVELLTHLLQLFLNDSNNMMMGPDRYKQILSFSFLLNCLSVAGKILFVIALFQLRSQLRQFKAALSGETG